MTTTTTAPVAAPTGATRLHPATLLVILAGMFMSTLDFFIVNVAIPQTQLELGATDAQVQWWVAGYALAMAGGLITAGRLGDLYGRRRLYVLGVALFTLASLLCGVAPGAGTLIAGRVLQGLGSALLAPQVLALLGVLYTGAARVKAFTAYGLVLGLAGSFGQLIGGLLMKADPAGLGWRTCFLVNLPVGIVTVLAAKYTVPHDKPSHTARLDLPGSVLVTAGLLALVFPLVQGRQLGWPLWSDALFLVAVLVLGLFVVNQRRLHRSGGSPLVHLDLFRVPSYRTGLLAAAVFFGGNVAMFLVLALYLQFGRGLDPLAAGAVFTVLGVGFIATSMTGPRLARLLKGYTLATGALVMAAGLAATGAVAAHHGSIAALVGPLLVYGAGMGAVMAPFASVVLAGVDAQHAGSAAGVLSTVQQVANALGVALIGVVFYGQAGHGLPHAFAVSVAWLVPSVLVVAALLALPSLRVRS
jgi:EmrB/QacA subfamily drug resistance transporter